MDWGFMIKFNRSCRSRFPIDVPPTHNIEQQPIPSNSQPSSSPSIVMTKGDSAASQHYIRPEDKACLSNILPYNGPSVILPDADKIAPSHQGDITISNKLSKNSTTRNYPSQTKKFNLNLTWSIM